MSKKQKRMARIGPDEALKEASDIAQMPLRELAGILKDYPQSMARIVKAIARTALSSHRGRK